MGTIWTTWSATSSWKRSRLLVSTRSAVAPATRAAADAHGAADAHVHNMVQRRSLHHKGQDVEPGRGTHHYKLQ